MDCEKNEGGAEVFGLLTQKRKMRCKCEKGKRYGSEILVGYPYSNFFLYFLILGQTFFFFLF